MRGATHRSRLLGAFMLGAVLIPLVPQVPVNAQDEIGVNVFTVSDRRNDQLRPRIAGDMVVWQDYRDVAARTGDEFNADIYARDLANDHEIRIDNNHTSSSPDVSGRVVVYADNRNGDADIRGYDIRQDDSFWVVRRSGSVQDRPAIDGDIVVWQDDRDGNWDIRGKNLSNDDEFWVSHREGNQTSPRIAGRMVVWQDDRDGCCDIYVRNLDTGDVTRVTDSNDAYEPDISGDWIVYREGDENRASIYAYSLETGERTRLSTVRDDSRLQPSVEGRLAVWADHRNGDDYNVFAYDFETQSEYRILRSDEDQTQPVVSGRRVVWTDRNGDRGSKIRGANLSLPSSPSPTPSPSPSPQPGPFCIAASALPASLRDHRYYPQTGFRIDNDSIWNYFVHRGGVQNFGYPVSRTVMFLGLPTQFFQRHVVQIGPNGSPQLLNLLDPGLMPATNINFSTYPAVDPNVKAETPVVSEPSYATRIIDFTAAVAPDFWNGLPVRFFSTFNNQVTLQTAYPNGGGNSALLPLLNLELSGAPTSRPQSDPTNGNFVYQRFQRTILHYDAVSGITQPVLLADYFKDVLMGRAPGDLANQMAGSAFINQYNPDRPYGLNRPSELTGTDLCGAFQPQ